MNDNDTGRQLGPLGRTISVRAFGDTADEIELFALDEARRVFGADIPLAIILNYQINSVDPTSSLAPFAGGKGYCASVMVGERAGS